MLNFLLLDELIKTALKEDIGTGDITTVSSIPQDKTVHGRFIAKEAGVVCGLPVVKRVFELIDKSVSLTVLKEEGTVVEKGTVIAEIEGSAQSVLTGERVALNFLQHLSGIATKTKSCVDAVKDYRAVIADTRKTTPGLRVLEKYAVKAGGGSNHRHNLSDGVLIKDNHINAAGSIAAAVAAVRKNVPHTLKIEVEVENRTMIEEALAVRADIIMLDNMTLEEMKASVEFIAGRALVEASGNMGDRDLAAVAATGVDIISIGALTHSVRAMDISLRFQ